VVGGINYRVCTGARPTTFQSSGTAKFPGSPLGYGAFPFLKWDQGLTFAAFKDGTSNGGRQNMSERSFIKLVTGCTV
jgi:hypothetical protein